MVPMSPHIVLIGFALNSIVVTNRFSKTKEFWLCSTNNKASQKPQTIAPSHHTYWDLRSTTAAPT